MVMGYLRSRREEIKKPLKFDLEAHLDDAVRRQVEECRRWARVAGQKREQEFSPLRDLDLAAGQQGLAAEVVGRRHRLGDQAARGALREQARHVGGLHEADLDDQAMEAVPEL